MLTGFFGMMDGVVQMASRDMRVVAGLFVMAGVMVVGGGAVMSGGVFVVLGCLTMMLSGVRGHSRMLLWQQELVAWVAT